MSIFLPLKHVFLTSNMTYYQNQAYLNQKTHKKQQIIIKMHQIPFAKNYKSKIAYIFRQFRIQNVFLNLHQELNNTQKPKNMC